MGCCPYEGDMRQLASSLSVFCHVRPLGEGSVYKPGSRSSSEPDPHVGLPLLQNREKHIAVRFCQPVYAILLWHLELTRTLVFKSYKTQKNIVSETHVLISNPRMTLDNNASNSQGCGEFEFKEVIKAERSAWCVAR